MGLDLQQLAGLPSPFYRVAAKAIIFDDQQRMLMLFTNDGNAEVPGGGWEHDETFEACLRREITEELGVDTRSVAPIWFTFRDKSYLGWHMLRLVSRVELKSFKFQLEKGMREARFVTKEELLALEYLDAADGAIRDCVDIIWPKPD